MIRIGLPRALNYYEYEILWRLFFEELGAAIVVSEPTTRATLQIASRVAATELCFPAKVFAGHLRDLADRVDLVFVPSLRRLAHSATHCSNVVGLPDLARSFLPDPSKVLEVDLDLDEGRLGLAQAVWRAGRPLTWNPVQIARAAETAWVGYQEALQRRLSGALKPRQPAEVDGDGSGNRQGARPLTLAVVGHPYLMQDAYVNLNLLKRLQSLGARTLTPDMLPPGAADDAVLRHSCEAYWAYASSLLGAGVCFLESMEIDGLVAAIAFGCAPDSGLAPVLAQAAREHGVPMLTLTLDEHSGDAGLITRIEAFLDLLERKRHNR